MIDDEKIATNSDFRINGNYSIRKIFKNCLPIDGIKSCNEQLHHFYCNATLLMLITL